MERKGKDKSRDEWSRRQYGKGEGDTLTFLYNTWPERQSSVGFTRDDLDTVVIVVGKGNKKINEIL